MKRFWQIWLVCGVCLAVALPALAWLTMTALGLERAEQAARQQAKREERIRLASWRIDTMLMPIIAPEAARTYEDFEPHLSRQGAYQTGTSKTQPASKYVLAYFERSPEQAAYSQLFGRRNDRQSDQRMARLRQNLDYAALVARLPSELLPAGAEPIDANLAALDNAAKWIQSSQANQAPNAALDDDFQRRQEFNAINTAREVTQQRASKKAAPHSPQIKEGVSRPIWLGDDLLVARRVRVDGNEIVQGCWLDWDVLRADMRAEVADLLPDVQLSPVPSDREVNYAHALATLPVQLVVREAPNAGAGWTPLRVALVVAWSGLVVGVAALAALVAGVVSLSRRREAFVSAVTHELRTPLTTFRMYSEMLDAGMVADETKRKDYLRTLRVEADRLWHLVENVLAYARLERGRLAGKRERLTVAELWSRVESRLSDRAHQAGMELAREMDTTGDVALVTDPAAVEQILFNLVDNACKYAGGARSIAIHVEARAANGQVEIRVRDHGAGIAPSHARQLFRPFSKSAESAATSAPGVGLGLALCRRLARQMGGDLRYEPSRSGATFVLTLPRA